MNLTSEERAYIAGFWDGEGSFTLARKRKKDWFYYQACVQVGLTHKRTLKWISKKLNMGFIFSLYKSNEKHKQAYKLQITGIENVIKFIELVEPYLITKLLVAKALKGFCLSRRGKMHLPLKERGFTSKEVFFFESITTLNRRGI